MQVSGEQLARKMGTAKGLKAGPCLMYSRDTKRSGGWNRITERNTQEMKQAWGGGGEEAGSCRALQNFLKTVSS